jgi:hypothetical protein
VRFLTVKKFVLKKSMFDNKKLKALLRIKNRGENVIAVSG